MQTNYSKQNTQLLNVVEMQDQYDDSNSRDEYKGYTTNQLKLEILENGPKSLAQSWFLQAMHNDWKRKKGIKDPEPPDCQSSFKEWENSINKYKKTR